MAKAKAVGKAVSFAFSTGSLTAEIQKTIGLASHVQKSMHANATKEERQKIANIVQALKGVRAAAINVYCPNAYFGFYTVDETSIQSWPQGGAQPAKPAKKAKQAKKR